jgi:hypothetical protein
VRIVCGGWHAEGDPFDPADLGLVRFVRVHALASAVDPGAFDLHATAVLNRL